MRKTFILVLAALAGCNAAGPEFVPPVSGLPDAAFVASAKTAAPDPEWWAKFRDPLLTALVREVADANLDVQTATLRVAESRFQRGVTASAQMPSLNGDAKVTREQYSKNGILSLMNGLVPGGLDVPPISDHFVGFDAAWEIDIWGRVRRSVEAADAQVQVSEDQRRDALVSVMAETARDYIQLRGVQVQIGVLRDNVKVAEGVLKLAEERQAKGMQSALDTENARSQLEAYRAQIPPLEQQESELINALSFLTDQPPGALKARLGVSRKAFALASAPTGIVSDLARRRPDIRAAEAQLHAATAQTGVAAASFYPSITLSGQAGLDSLNTNNLLRASSFQWSVGPSVSVPIFEGGKLKNTLELRETQQQEAALAYRKTVLRAWHDVVNALVALRSEQARHARLTEQVSHARKAASIARDRYRDGVTEFINVLDAERTALSAEQQQAQSATTLGVDQVQLYKALGGGWEGTFPAE
ncbi:NodT family efflux transporter outer membrane factor (OMF) lipoprotein [Rhodoblastus acidophilus]|uniref:efflux transporter outer membrane subunit n=1 Tax=Rhodoblastus acidophilus TaxID=1074 RepID=UPI00222424FE|nr:efflux transporter outer membrane subunit [Rhodoblastus acidophilus]MCW2314934.1 NodT family efflux transporter outer membrane factor (OMF) lipoprotein [Rhodoblastus acidophilus]